MQKKIYRNEIFTNQITADNFYQYYYLNRLLTCEKTKSRILNREVGDEELFLDNSQLYGNASYSALTQLYVNVPHPYYNFDGQLNTTYKIPGMYCRTDPFENLGSGYAVLQSSLTPVYGYLVGRHDLISAPFYACCEVRSNEPSLSPEREVDSLSVNDSFLAIHPNPISKGSNLKIEFPEPVSSVVLYDLVGKQHALR